MSLQVELFVGRFLRHYASEYYDPAKAHEYYLRNRELKGRQSTKGMSDVQKEGWDYAKNQISERQKADIQRAGDERRVYLEQTRAWAQGERDKIGEKLKGLLQKISDMRADDAKVLGEEEKADIEKLAADTKAKSAEIREAAAQKIAALPPIPKGVSEERRAKLAAQRAEAVAKINGDAWNDLVTLSTKTKADHEGILATGKKRRENLAVQVQADRELVRASASASREAVSGALKGAVEKARSDYEARKEQIKAEYEATKQREYEGIRGNLPSAPASSGSSGKKKSSKKDAAPSNIKPGVKTRTLQEAAEDTVRRLNLKP